MARLPAVALEMDQIIMAQLEVRHQLLQEALKMEIQLLVKVDQQWQPPLPRLDHLLNLVPLGLVVRTNR